MFEENTRRPYQRNVQLNFKKLKVTTFPVEKIIKMKGDRKGK
jgi:hypothetical protein